MERLAHFMELDGLAVILKPQVIMGRVIRVWHFLLHETGVVLPLVRAVDKLTTICHHIKLLMFGEERLDFYKEKYYVKH